MFVLEHIHPCEHHLSPQKCQQVQSVLKVVGGCGQVRNAANGIVQMQFGDDGLDPVAMEARSGGGPLDFERLLAAQAASLPSDAVDLAPSERPLPKTVQVRIFA